LWQAQAAYAVVATLIDLSTRPLTAMPLNSPIVITGVAIALVNVWACRDRIPPLFRNRAILAGATTLMLFALNENLGRPVAPNVNLEPIGMLAFVAALGYAVVGTVLRGEAELVAVQRELDTARRIQESLLPREAPRVQGLEVALRYRPMTAVAGDLYDFAVLGPSRLGILVADVAGHGVPAALVASMVKLAFATQSAEAHDPAALLTSMNRVLCRHVERAFVTAVYAVVDTARATVTSANAGHPSLLVGRADGRVEAIDERGLVLGFFDQAPYANAERPLFAGDRILLYTDGVPEAQNAHGEFFDSDRLRAWLARDGDAASIAESALRDLRRFRGADGFDDDVTLVVARCAS
jgi:serine phosphatase RsbU (regulator of sigma subunit)